MNEAEFDMLVSFLEYGDTEIQKILITKQDVVVIDCITYLRQCAQRGAPTTIQVFGTHTKTYLERYYTTSIAYKIMRDSEWCIFKRDGYANAPEMYLCVPPDCELYNVYRVMQKMTACA